MFRRQFTDYTAMLDAVDIVVLATPENLARATVNRSVRSGEACYQ